jgi:hypothetical protein
MKITSICIYVVIIVSLGLQATLAQNALFVKQKTGTNTPFNLSSIRSLTFESGKVTVNVKELIASSFVRSEIRCLNFGTNLSTENTTPTDSKDELLKIFPNPVRDILNLEFANISLKPVQIEIISFDGKVALRTVLKRNKTSIPVSTLPKGIYLLHGNNGLNSINIKFIKY